MRSGRRSRPSIRWSQTSPHAAFTSIPGDHSHDSSATRRSVSRDPVSGELADVVTSSGVMNLLPDKTGGLSEMARVLRPGGRLQIGDILVTKAVPQCAKRDVDIGKG